MRRIHFDITDSTNTQARRLAAIHTGERLLVTATEQTAGRGRQGRQWLSPRGGAWMTIVWPMRLPPIAYRATSLAAAIGVRRALVELLDRGLPAEAAGLAARPAIKWPNDVLLEDAKVAGILCEQAHGGIAGGAVLIGIGVNVAFAQSLLEETSDGQPLRHRATTLSNVAGRQFEVEETLLQTSTAVVAAIEQLEEVGLSRSGVGGGAALIDELREALAYVGTRRTWSSPRGEVAGRIVGIDDEGRLLLHDGEVVIACDAGELSGEA
jgi:BirA family transcriptional regulator, biotin operon repressor / biotin---[acetyl-CoA-carboxylase] ligase